MDAAAEAAVCAVQLVMGQGAARREINIKTHRVDGAGNQKDSQQK